MSYHFQLDFDESLETITYLRSGDLTCLYQHGKLRYIRYKDNEVIRMIYSAVRDENWNTAPYVISDEKIQQHENGFEIKFKANYHMNDIMYEAVVNISAKENEVQFLFEGKATSDFKRNRIGICLLHTVDAIRDREVEVTQPDGNTYRKIFPAIISPHQPVKNVSGMRWSFGKGEIVVHFEGDIFENEDQRNWTDSSFKTYSTPLDRPLPVEVHKGDSVSQSLKLSIHKSEQQIPEKFEDNGLGQTPFPAIGFCKVKGRSLTREEIRALSEIIFDHYRVELHMSDNTWNDELLVAVKEARQMDVTLQLTVFFDGNDTKQVLALRQSLESIHHLVESILVVDAKTNRTDAETLHQVYDRLKPQYPAVKLGYGTTNHFADLNRNLPSGVQYDFVSFGVTPQAHSTDTISLLENLDTQRDTINTLQANLGNVKIHVAPITFKGRKATLFTEDKAPADYDERQHKQLGAAWLVKTLQHFSGNSITLFDAVGYKGVISDDHWRSKPSAFYSLLRELKKFAPNQFVKQSESVNDVALKNANGEVFVIGLDERYGSYRAFRQPL